LHDQRAGAYDRFVINGFSILLAQATSEDVPVPLSSDWAASLMLVILWIFVAAAVVGPMVTYLKIVPRFTGKK
jgi:hypothetical protein